MCFVDVPCGVCEPNAPLACPSAVNGGESPITEEAVVEGDACGLQFRGGEVAATDGKVGSDISDDIDELEGLSEEAGLSETFRRGWPLSGKEVDDFGPELANAARDEIGVFFEFGLIREEPK